MTLIMIKIRLRIQLLFLIIMKRIIITVTTTTTRIMQGGICPPQAGLPRAFAAARVVARPRRTTLAPSSESGLLVCLFPSASLSFFDFIQSFCFGFKIRKSICFIFNIAYFIRYYISFPQSSLIFRAFFTFYNKILRHPGGYKGPR